MKFRYQTLQKVLKKEDNEEILITNFVPAKSYCAPGDVKREVIFDEDEVFVTNTVENDGNKNSPGKYRKYIREVGDG